MLPQQVNTKEKIWLGKGEEIKKDRSEGNSEEIGDTTVKKREKKRWNLKYVADLQVV